MNKNQHLEARCTRCQTIWRITEANLSSPPCDCPDDVEVIICMVGDEDEHLV